MAAGTRVRRRRPGVQRGRVHPFGKGQQCGRAHRPEETPGLADPLVDDFYTIAQGDPAALELLGDPGRDPRPLLGVLRRQGCSDLSYTVDVTSLQGRVWHPGAVELQRPALEG